MSRLSAVRPCPPVEPDNGTLTGISVTFLTLYPFELDMPLGIVSCTHCCVPMYHNMGCLTRAADCLCRPEWTEGQADLRA